MSTQNPTAPPGSPSKLLQSDLYKDWFWRAGSGDPNDYILAISANPRWTGVSGTGKTTLGLRLADDYFDTTENGFDAKRKATLDPAVLADEIYPQTEEGSAIIYDEAQGTRQSTGLNSKRHNKTEVLEAVNTIATYRDERKTLIVITQNIKALVNEMYDFIDAWLMINNEVNHVATHYKVHPNVFNFETQKTETPGVEDIRWQPYPKSDPNYRHLKRLKDESKRVAKEEGEQALPLEIQAELAVSLKQAYDVPWTDVPELSDRLTYTGNYLRKSAKDQGIVERLESQMGADNDLPKEVQAELAVEIKSVRECSWHDVPKHSERLTYTGESLRQTAKDLGLA